MGESELKSSYSGGIDWKDLSFRPAQVKSSETPDSINKRGMVQIAIIQANGKHK
jgi:hypothetical protein